VVLSTYAGRHGHMSYITMSDGRTGQMQGDWGAQGGAGWGCWLVAGAGGWCLGLVASGWWLVAGDWCVWWLLGLVVAGAGGLTVLSGVAHAAPSLTHNFPFPSADPHSLYLG